MSTGLYFALLVGCWFLSAAADVINMRIVSARIFPNEESRTLMRQRNSHIIGAIFNAALGCLVVLYFILDAIAWPGRHPTPYPTLLATINFLVASLFAYWVWKRIDKAVAAQRQLAAARTKTDAAGK